MKLALERSEKDIVRSLYDRGKNLPSAYGDLDVVRCSDEDPRPLNDKMLQLAVVHSNKLGSRDRVPEL